MPSVSFPHEVCFTTHFSFLSAFSSQKQQHKCNTQLQIPWASVPPPAPIQNSQQSFVVHQFRVTFGIQGHQPQADTTSVQVVLGRLSLQLDVPDTTFYWKWKPRLWIILICITNARCLTSHNGPQPHIMDFVLSFNNSSLIVSRCF